MYKKKQDDAVVQTGRQDQQRPDSKGRSGLFFVLLLILVVGASLFYFYRHTLVQQQTDQSLRSELTALQGKLNQLEHGLGQQFTALQAENNALRQALERIDQRPASLELDLTLAEVEHLLTIAIQRLELDRNVAIALAAVETADQRLLNISVPGIIDMRRQLTEDINALRAVDAVDVIGLALYLADMINHVDRLQLKSSVILPDQEKQQGEQTMTDPRPISKLIWQELKGMMTIKRKDEVIKVLPDEQYYIYQYLRLELANARLAVLQRDTTNMQESVRMILNWLDRYFVRGDAAVTNLITALTRMQSLELMPILPDIDSSLEAVRALRRQDRIEATPDYMMDMQ